MWRPERARVVARQHMSLDTRVEALVALIPLLSAGTQSEVAQHMLAEAWKIVDASRSARVLTALIPFLSGEDRETAKAAAWRTAAQTPWLARATCLAPLIKDLPPPDRCDLVQRG